jgi:hypothetical protein
MSRTIVAAPHGANTEDIIQALARALPGATQQIPEYVPNPGKWKSEPLRAALTFARFIQVSAKYKRDGLDNQKIVLPKRLVGHTGDCKSFALFNAAVLAYLGIKGGIRFASYKPNQVPTHVYNYVEIDGKRYPYDSTLKNLQESPNFTYLRDMQITYLAGVPTMVEAGTVNGRRAVNGYIGSKKGKKRREERREKRRAEGKGFGQRAKKISLAGPRGAFLGLVRLNFRGIASKLNKLNTKNPKRLREFWLKLGGDPDKLKSAFNAGAAKKPLFGSKGVGAWDSNDFIGDFIGEPVTAATLIAAAGGILVAIQKLFKSEGKEFSDDDLAPKDAMALDPTGEGFEAADPETKEAEEYGKKAAKVPPKETDATNALFKPSTLLLLLGATVAYKTLT